MAKRFQTLGTADLTQRIFRVEVQDSLLKPSNFPAFLTTYDNWAFDAKERLDDGFGAYVYIGPDEAPAGSSAFLFGPPTAGTARTKYDVIESYPWVPVLTSLSATAKLHVDGYVADYFWSYNLKSYRGPTKVKTTEQWSAQRFTISVPGSIMQGQAFAHSYYQNTFSLPETLHAAVSTITLATKGTANHPSWGDVSTSFSLSATTLTDWPSTHIISDRQEPAQGGWLRKTVEAYAPGT
jgi:hypothetical protein